MAKAMKRVGQWDKVGRICKDLRQTIKTEAGRDLADSVTWGEKTAVKFVRDQSLSWQPLNPAYREQKMKEGKSSKTLIASSQYLQSISSNASYPHAWVGVKRTARSKDGESLVDIARVHEFGAISLNIPSRPLWSVINKHLQAWWKKRNTSQRIVNRLMRK